MVELIGPGDLPGPHVAVPAPHPGDALGFRQLRLGGAEIGNIMSTSINPNRFAALVALHADSLPHNANLSIGADDPMRAFEGLQSSQRLFRVSDKLPALVRMNHSLNFFERRLE